MVDGWDSDDVVDTVKFSVSPDSSDKVDLQVTADVSVTYPDEAEEYPISAHLFDSKFGEATEQVAKMKVDTDSDTNSGSTSDSNSNSNSDSNSNTGSTDPNTNTNSGVDDTGSTTVDTDRARDHQEQGGLLETVVSFFEGLF